MSDATTIEKLLHDYTRNSPWKHERPISHAFRRLRCPTCEKAVLFAEVCYPWGSVFVCVNHHRFETDQNQTPAQMTRERLH